MADLPKRLILGFLPTNLCNLQCPYCYISQLKQWEKTGGNFRYHADHMVRCLSMERLGGPCLINLTAQGETTLYPEIVELVGGLLHEGHYVELVTNLLVTKRVEALLKLPAEDVARLEFKVSFHYFELKRKGVLDRFFENVQKIADSPASFTLELMPHDEIEGEIDQIIELTKAKVGAPCHLTVGRNDAQSNRSLLTAHTRDEYVKIWSAFDSPMFRFKMDLVDVHRREFCYAGAWTLFIDMATGEARQCYGQPSNQNVFKDPAKPVKFVPVGRHCTEPFCINGHAFLALGAIPTLETPTYATVRDRITVDGSSWIKEPCRSFFSHRLKESNRKLTRGEQLRNSMAFPFRFLAWALQSAPETATRIRRRVMRGRRA